MLSRTRFLVPAIVATAALVAVVAVAASNFGDGEDRGAQACGEEPTGPVDGVGVTPIKYETLDEASQAFGFEMPDVTAPGWSFAGAYGAEPESITPGGSFSFYAAFLVYECESTGASFELSINPAGGSQDVELESVTLEDGLEVGLVRQEGRAGALWEEDGRAYTAMASIDEAFSEADFLHVLASLE